jgi:elongation factor Ts
MVNASLVKDLREKTGAGMMDCKRALSETNGDMEKAIDWLREKGISKAAKKADRIAAEGLCNVVVNKNEAFIYELNSETDFVAKNSQFIELLNNIGQACINEHCMNTESALVAKVNGEKVEDLLISLTAKIGEKISLRRVIRVVKQDDEVFGVYKHMGGRIAVVCVLKGNDAVLAEDMCMHICAMNPKYLTAAQVPQEELDHEKAILTQEALNENAEAEKPKPVDIVEKMVIGRVKKYLKDICLVDQIYVKNQDLTVGQELSNHKSACTTYVRFEVGEGMEKRANDFAAEVAAQLAEVK